MYHEGLGIPDDNILSIGWFQRLAEKGHIMAQYRLAEMYYQGEGVDENYIEAYAWFGVVAARGFKAAENSRDKIENHLNKTETDKARALAREYWAMYGSVINTQ